MLERVVNTVLLLIHLYLRDLLAPHLPDEYGDLGGKLPEEQLIKSR
ncbi:MAG: hypothetical protein ACI88A_000426 [Paraglaciecola sp.]|jgi:hypothetical protein